MVDDSIGRTRPRFCKNSTRRDHYINGETQALRSGRVESPLSLERTHLRVCPRDAVRCAAERNARRSGAVLCPFSLTWFAGVGKRRRLDDWTTKDTKNGREKEERAPR